jgi:hypothetical protein
VTREVRAAVARYERRPLLWVAAAAVLFVALVVVDASTSHAAQPHDDDVLVDAVVTGTRANGDLSVRYRHPVTRQTIEVDVDVRRAALRPPTGSTVQLIASSNDPGDVDVRGDRAATTDVVWELLPFVALPLLVYGRRRWHRRRVEQLIGDGGTSFAMLGALGPPRAGGTHPMLSLYALDAAAGSPALCAVPVLLTHGAPFDSVLAVDVKGSPRPSGRVVVRHRDSVLWPTGRAAGRAGIALPSRPAPPTTASPTTASTTAMALARPRWSSWARTWAVEWIAVATSIALVGLVATITLVHAADARELERTGDPIVVTVVGRGDTVVNVRYRAADGSEITTTTPVSLPGDYTVGRRYPARVDPRDPQRLRLLAEPFDAFTPIAWATTPLVAALVWLASRALRFRRVRRRAPRRDLRRFGGRVVRMGTRVADLEIGRFDEPGARCTVRVPNVELGRLFHGEVLVGGDPAPGAALAVGAGDRSLTVLGPARCPQKP